MKTITKNLYSFEELDKEIQDKIINENTDINIQGEWWDFLFEDFNLELENIGLTSKDFYYDLDRGSYFKIEKPYVKDERIFLQATGNEKELFLLDLLESVTETEITEINISENNRHYVVDIHYTNDGEKFADEITNIADRMAGNIDDYMEKLTDKFLKILQEHHDYLLSDEAIEETIIANEYYFTEDGKRE